MGVVHFEISFFADLVGKKADRDVVGPHRMAHKLIFRAGAAIHKKRMLGILLDHAVGLNRGDIATKMRFVRFVLIACGRRLDGHGQHDHTYQ